MRVAPFGASRRTAARSRPRCEQRAGGRSRGRGAPWQSRGDRPEQLGAKRERGKTSVSLLGAVAEPRGHGVNSRRPGRGPRCRVDGVGAGARAAGRCSVGRRGRGDVCLRPPRQAAGRRPRRERSLGQLAELWVGLGARGGRGGQGHGRAAPPVRPGGRRSRGQGRLLWRRRVDARRARWFRLETAKPHAGGHAERRRGAVPRA
mmetsp:Transcript_19459/g.74632  ORF Transcript_19459/g.74632 Transcript_19459/m.74632 type:complete len:204 (+) Transcript_19459:1415-2026(+)